MVGFMPRAMRVDGLLGERGARDSSFILRAIAARLRIETTLPIKWIAARVQIGTAKRAKSVLPHPAPSQGQRKTPSALDWGERRPPET
jgi:hypothetical protein